MGNTNEFINIIISIIITLFVSFIDFVALFVAGDAEELGRTHEYLVNSVKSKANVCLICIETVKRNDPVSFLVGCSILRYSQLSEILKFWINSEIIIWIISKCYQLLCKIPLVRSTQIFFLLGNFLLCNIPAKPFNIELSDQFLDISRYGTVRDVTPSSIFPAYKNG